MRQEIEQAVSKMLEQDFDQVDYGEPPDPTTLAWKPRARDIFHNTALDYRLYFTVDDVRSFLTEVWAHANELYALGEIDPDAEDQDFAEEAIDDWLDAQPKDFFEDQARTYIENNPLQPGESVEEQEFDQVDYGDETDPGPGWMIAVWNPQAEAARKLLTQGTRFEVEGTQTFFHLSAEQDMLEFTGKLNQLDIPFQLYRDYEGDEETMQEQEQDYADASFHFAPSQIHGNGLMVRQSIKAGADLGVTHRKRSEDEWEMLPTGNYNHSELPTAMVVSDELGVRQLVALQDLDAGDELTVDYSQQPDLEQPGEDWV